MPILLPNRAEVIYEWQTAIETLYDQIRCWLAERKPEWSLLEAERIAASEESLGAYTVRKLSFGPTPEERIELTPVARIVFGGQGTIEMLALTTMYRVRLLHTPDKAESPWTILMNRK